MSPGYIIRKCLVTLLVQVVFGPINFAVDYYLFKARGLVLYLILAGTDGLPLIASISFLFYIVATRRSASKVCCTKEFIEQDSLRTMSIVMMMTTRRSSMSTSTRKRRPL